MKKTADDEKPLTLTLAAQKLGVSKPTLWRLVSEGKVKAFRLSEKGHYRIQTSEIDRILKGK